MKNIVSLTVVILASMFPTVAQQTSDAPHALTASDYARAEKWMGYNTNPLVFRSGVRPAWQGDNRFWYRITTPEGSEFVMVETAKGTRTPAFAGRTTHLSLTIAAGTESLQITITTGTTPFTIAPGTLAATIRHFPAMTLAMGHTPPGP